MPRIKTNNAVTERGTGVRRVDTAGLKPEEFIAKISERGRELCSIEERILYWANEAKLSLEAILERSGCRVGTLERLLGLDEKAVERLEKHYKKVRRL